MLYLYRMKRFLAILILLLASTVVSAQQRFIQFVYVSDCHYGIERDFRGRHGVTASDVSRAMVGAIESLPAMTLPADGGVRGGSKIEWVDYLINTGDIANRAEKGVQRSARSWRQFQRDWSSLGLRDFRGEVSPLFLLPGNHDISNAIGHPSIPRRNTDATSAAEIYNAMLRPDTLITKRTYDRDRHLCNYSFEAGGVLFAFVDMWPDTRNRAWLDTELNRLHEGDASLLFVHDQPDIEAKHLKAPIYEGYPIIGFENLVGDTSSVANRHKVPEAEHRQLREFLRTRPAIKGYFHGNENYNEFYEWGAPETSVPVFRVDSPMKGSVSSEDESQLSFQFVVIDTQERAMTVRELFWNRPNGGTIWGETITVKL